MGLTDNDSQRQAQSNVTAARSGFIQPHERLNRLYSLAFRNPVAMVNDSKDRVLTLRGKRYMYGRTAVMKRIFNQIIKQTRQGQLVTHDETGIRPAE